VAIEGDEILEVTFESVLVPAATGNTLDAPSEASAPEAPGFDKTRLRGASVAVDAPAGRRFPFVERFVDGSTKLTRGDDEDEEAEADEGAPE